MREGEVFLFLFHVRGGKTDPNEEFPWEGEVHELPVCPCTTVEDDSQEDAEQYGEGHQDCFNVAAFGQGQAGLCCIDGIHQNSVR